MSGGSLYVGAAGVVLQQVSVQLTANNLANAATSGFKAEFPAFRIPPEPEGKTPAAAGEPAMLPLNESYTDFQAGPLRNTGNPLDVAILGDGFFVIQTPEGEQYTRQGQFYLNGTQNLVTADGFPVLGDGGPLTVDGSRVSIASDGTVSVDGEEAGRLRLVTFDSPLTRTSHAAFVPENPATVAQPATDATVVQGTLEMSNTDVVKGMTDMITAHRLMEAYQKVIQAVEDMDKKATELGRID